jgi:xanthine dehydrogenase accessory factor
VTERRPLVLIKGAGDLATGSAVRLARSGFRVAMTELAEPTAVRRTVAFSEAVAAGRAAVEGVAARRVGSAAEARRVMGEGQVAVLVEPGAPWPALRPLAVVDARMAKRNLGTSRDEAPVVIGLGPGFTAGADVHAVVETNRGHTLGTVLLEGAAQPNTGVPGEIGGYGPERLLRAPIAGILAVRVEIGERVEAGAVVALVAGQPVRARIAGIVRGLLRDGAPVREGQKVGDVDPRARREHCFTVSDKARAVAGGVLEAILYLSRTAKPASGWLALPTTTRASRRSGEPRRNRARA